AAEQGDPNPHELSDVLRLIADRRGPEHGGDRHHQHGEEEDRVQDPVAYGFAGGVEGDGSDLSHRSACPSRATGSPPRALAGGFSRAGGTATPGRTSHDDSPSLPYTL